ncbi:MAG: restriction endonuclease subunit S [Lachnospiraceae bacterium]|nr:restriction endonuclease subunit S [Lachnospiraceae bacterium]
MHYEKFQDGTVKCIEDEIPFEVPEGWAWTRVSSMVQICLGLTHTPDYVDKGIAFYSVKDISAGCLDTSNPKYISEEEFSNFPSGAKPQKGDILFGRVGTLGKPTVVELEEPFGIFVSLGFFRKIYEPLSSEYIMNWMDSSLFWNQVSVNVKGAVLTNLNTGWLSRFLIPIPPLNEQYIITDYLKELLGKINYITSTKEELGKLLSDTKSKILDLAIRGKLVPQDPNDEPASVLLERIRAEKEELIKQGKIKRDKKESIIFRGDDNSYYEDINGKVVCIDNEIPFDIPDTWTWCRLKSIASNENNSFVDGPFGSDLKTIHYTENEEVRIVQLNNISEDGWKDNGKKYTTFSHAKNIERCISFPKDIVIAKMMPAGRTIILPSINSIYVISSDCIRLRADYRLNKEYLMFMLNSPSINKCVLNTVQGIGRTRTSLNKMKELLIPVPPETEQQKISETIIKYFGYLTKIYSSL